MDDRLTYRRPYLMPDGSVRDVFVAGCHCGADRRGPAGGVCGNCGGAIPEAPPRPTREPAGPRKRAK